MPQVSFSLNGKKVEVEAGTTILEAAQQNGVDIPTLCSDPRLKPTAACRLCLVEVEGARGLMPACTTPVQESMAVRIKTDHIVKLRRMALELLLSDHYGDCIAPCQLTCPAGIDIQGYIALIANGQYREAVELIKERNPMPLVVGRVCPRFCETKCRRNLVDEAVAINALKRFAADYDLNNGDRYVPQVKSASGRRVAIVGGGPAGLSAAYYLALEGHEVTIFDVNPKLGGMLRYGIPEYRLPKAILDEEIALITSLCHEVRLGVSLGRDFTLESLKSEGCETVFLGLGAWSNQKMRVEGEDLLGVISGIGFLRDIALGEKVSLGEKVAVIGGGNTAMDAARTALRLGAKEVSIIYRRSRAEMPANDEEIEQAEEEGIQFQFLASPVKLSGHDGRVDTMECIRMALGEPDSSGRRRPEPISGSEFTAQVDTVVAAIGQRLNPSGLDQDGRVELNRRGYVGIEEETMVTSQGWVFSGGDCASGPATVIEAIAAGRRAAISINQYLNGQAVAPVEKPYNCTKGELEEIDIGDYEDVPRVPRNRMPALKPEARKKHFGEIELGFTKKMVEVEAGRCLSCGCQDVFECKLRELATEYAVNDANYAGRKRHLSLREDEHPYILRDPNKCILCGNCVRICSEVEGVNALGFAQRGFKTVIEPALAMPLMETTCESCGQCVSTCPTGALTPKVQLPKPGPWKLEAIPTICPYCGIGCNLELDVIGDKIVKVTSPLNSLINGGNLCEKGAFNPVSIDSLEQFRTPLIRRNGDLVKANWGEAIAFTGERFKQIRDGSGGGKLAVLVSAQLSNEEAYLAQKIARAALGTNNIGTLAAAPINESLMECFGRNASTVSYSDILTSDLILVYGTDLTEDYPIIGLKVRQAVTEGSQLIIFNSRATRIDSLAKAALKVNRRMAVDLIVTMLCYILSHNLVDNEFINSQVSGFKEFTREIKRYPLGEDADGLWVKPSRIVELADLYFNAQSPVIIVNADTITPAELTLLSDLALITGNVGQGGGGIVALRAPGNAQGLIDMGVTPRYLPGQQLITVKSARQKFETAWSKPLPSGEGKDFAGIVKGVKTREIKGIFIIGSDVTNEIKSILSENQIFTVLLGTALPKNWPYPDVILPGANFAESEGTYTNCERRIQRLHRAISPSAGRENWEIILALSASLGYPMNYHTISSIYDEVADLVPLYKLNKAQKDSGEGVQWPFKGGRKRLKIPNLNGFKKSI